MRALGIGRRQALHDVAAKTNKSVFIRTKGKTMSEENDNKAVVGRWFEEFWGKTCDLTIVDEIAAPDMLLKYSLHKPRRGHADIKAQFQRVNSSLQVHRGIRISWIRPV